MELIKFNDPLIRSLNYMCGVIDAFKDVPLETPSTLNSEVVPFVRGFLGAIKDSFNELEMPLVLSQAERAINSLDSGNLAKVYAELSELNTRIMESLSFQILLVLPSSRKQNFEEPLADWGKVPEKFPSAIKHIEEAERCFALNRNTGCVFHLMGVMQVGLIELARHLRKPVDLFDKWETLIGKVETGIDAKRSSMNSKRWRVVEHFYSEIVSDLRAVKNAWRNPTMHFRRTYDEAEAAKVKSKVKDFMLHLSLKVKERGA
jgi:hypothetical protein